VPSASLTPAPLRVGTQLRDEAVEERGMPAYPYPTSLKLLAFTWLSQLALPVCPTYASQRVFVSMNQALTWHYWLTYLGFCWETYVGFDSLNDEIDGLWNLDSSLAVDDLSEGINFGLEFFDSGG
jgi:hypothetical protein